MAREDLMQAVASGPLVCDGAMGTQLMARGLASGSCGELWNIQRPDQVEAIHRSYRDAGCDLLTTNSFGGTTSGLDRHGLAARARELNLAAARVARQAAGDRAWVLGDIGPFGGFLEPVGDTTRTDLLAIFAAQAEALIEGGVDAIIVETMSDPTEMAVAIDAVRSVSKDLPVIATYAFGHGGSGTYRTMMGNDVTEALGRAVDAGADVVGANCGTSLSLDDYVSLASALVRASGGRPVILQPNAGSPQTVNGKLHYAATPDDMAQIVPQLLSEGVRIIGGCCGTTPAHLAAISSAVRAGTSRRS